jgi:hypothetical protein
MDQPLDRIPIVVQHEHDRVQPQLQQICESLHGEVQTTLTRDQDTSFVFARFLDGFESSKRSSGGIPNAAEDRLVVHAGAAGEFGAAEAEGGSAGFSDDEVAGFEELAESLVRCQYGSYQRLLPAQLDGLRLTAQR